MDDILLLLISLLIGIGGATWLYLSSKSRQPKEK